MKNWKIELTTGWKTLAEVKIQGSIFQGDSLSLFLFVIAMMPLNYLGSALKCTDLQNCKQMSMDDIKQFAKNEKELEFFIQAIRIYSQDIGMKFGLEKGTMFIMKSGKRQITE